MTASAANGTPRGMVALYQDGGQHSFPQANQAGEDAIALDLDDGSCSTTTPTIYPSQIEPYLGNPFWHVLLRTEDSGCGYDWSHVRHLIEDARPDGRSRAQLIQAHTNIEWILQIGNEPDSGDHNTPDFPINLTNGQCLTDCWWGQRWYMIRIYDELATNSYGHISQAWRQKYPALKWAVAVGVNYDAMLVHLQFQTADAGVRDRYDYVACHVYADWDMRYPQQVWLDVYNYLLNDQYTKGIAISEFGINGDPTQPPTDWEVQNYRGWVNNLPSKVKFATAFVAMYPTDQWTTYALDSATDGQTLGDHWGGYPQ